MTDSRAMCERTMPGLPETFTQLRVWDWQDAVAAAPRLNPAVKIFALTIARYGHALSGTRVKIKPAEKADLLDISRETVGRRVRSLVEAGYMVRSKAPGPDGPAEYTLFGPPAYARTRVKPDPTLDEGLLFNPTQGDDQRSAVRPKRAPDQRSATADSEPTSGHQPASPCPTCNAERSSNTGLTLVNCEPDDDPHKQVSNSSSSVQQLLRQRAALIAEAKRIADEVQLNGQRAGNR